MAQQPLTKQKLDEFAERGSQLAERLMDQQLILNNTRLKQIEHMRTLQTTKDPKVCNATLELPFHLSLHSLNDLMVLLIRSC